MKYIFILILFLAASLADDVKNKITRGFGPYIQSQPYKDVDDMILASPVIFYDNNILYVRWTRFGVYFLGEASDTLSWGFSLTAQPMTNGYYENDSKYLDGLSDKDSSWEGGLAFSASYNDAYLEMMYMYDLLNKYNSYTAKIELGYSLKFEKISFYPSIAVVYQNKDFLNYYYGVTQKENSSIHPQYSTDSDFKYQAQTYISYSLTKELSAFFNTKIDLLSKEAINSPITDKKYYYSGIASLIYTFDF